MAGGAGDPAPRAHGRQGGVEKDLAAHPLRRLGRRTHGHRRLQAHGLGVVNADREIERIVDVDRLAVGADAHGPGILADADRSAEAFDFTIIVVDDLRHIHVIGAGVDRVEPRAVGRQRRLPGVGDHVNAVVGVEPKGGPPLRAVGRDEVADGKLRKDRAAAIDDLDFRADMR